VSTPLSLAKYLALAEGSGLHLLTRRQILDFILAEPSKRNELVAALLRVEAIDSIRKELQGAAKQANENVGRHASVLSTQESALFRVFRQPPSDLDGVLATINAHRRVLGAAPLETLRESGILGGVPPLAQAAANPLQSQRVRSAFAEVTAWARTSEAVWVTSCQAYLGDIASLRAHSAKLGAMRAVKLIETGLRLTDGNVCPLCLTPWERGTLIALLKKRMEDGKEAQAETAIAEATRQRLHTEAARIVTHLRGHAADLEVAHADAARAVLTHAECLEDYTKIVIVPVTEGELPADPDVERARAALQNHSEWNTAVDALSAAFLALPDLEGAQQAWDELTGASRTLSELRMTAKALRPAKVVATQLDLAHQCFLQARDDVLQEVYDAISNKFTDFYTEIHKYDDDAFEARLDPTKAGLKLEVGFHDKGTFPPGAVHSEGHQDSMGLCLFLALVEHLAGSALGPIILDDVVMSVDREHRRSVAELLHQRFPGTQFILTTHDRVWWHQLRTVGLVGAKGAHEFRSWTLADGPEADVEPLSILGTARVAVQANDIPRAAHQLRRTVEVLGPELCDRLGAPLRFRADGGWNAGEYMDAAISRFRHLLKKAKAAANSWNQDMTGLVERDETLTEVNRRLGGERWAVNVAIHFNEWADLTPNDFRPVLEAHEALLAQFFCTNCESLLYVLEDGPTESTLRCACGMANMNLLART
jgi:hypothetical protein